MTEIIEEARRKEQENIEKAWRDAAKLIVSTCPECKGLLSSADFCPACNWHHDSTARVYRPALDFVPLDEYSYLYTPGHALRGRVRDQEIYLTKILRGQITLDREVDKLLEPSA